MADIYDHIAATLRELRANYGGKGISQEALAEHIGRPANTVSRWETGTYKPTARDLDRLARFFGVPITVFFPESGAQEANSAPVQGLLSALGDLSPSELDEVRKYAQFRKAHRDLETAKRSKKRTSG